MQRRCALLVSKVLSLKIEAYNLVNVHFLRDKGKAMPPYDACTTAKDVRNSFVICTANKRHSSPQDNVYSTFFSINIDTKKRKIGTLSHGTHKERTFTIKNMNSADSHARKENTENRN